jgi:hypothetical protein
MTILDVMFWLAIVGNVACAVWNITRARAFNRALEATTQERAELLVKVNAALAMPRTVDQMSTTIRPFFRPPDGQASNSGGSFG